MNENITRSCQTGLASMEAKFPETGEYWPGNVEIGYYIMDNWQTR